MGTENDTIKAFRLDAVKPVTDLDIREWKKDEIIALEPNQEVVVGKGTGLEGVIKYKIKFDDPGRFSNVGFVWKGESLQSGLIVFRRGTYGPTLDYGDGKIEHLTDRPSDGILTPKIVQVGSGSHFYLIEVIDAAHLQLLFVYPQPSVAC